MLKKIILSLAAVTVIVIVLSVIIDTRRNNSFTPAPSRPSESIQMDPDGLLYAFHHDLEVDAEEQDINIENICRYVDGRYDCSDFRLVSLMRILYLYPEGLSEDQHARIKQTLTSFKYWLDEPGADSMCYWSENHQILFATAELLAGKLYPDEIFSNDGLIGREHQARGRERVLTWLEQRWNYGFTEYYSNVYYVEDIGPMSNLIDLSDDDEIITKTQIIMDLLIHDLATQSYKGTFLTTSGRAYENNRKSGQNNSMKSVAQYIWGYPLGGEDRKGMDLGFQFIENYEVPEVIRLIGLDHSEQVIKASNGLNVSELKGEGLIGLETHQIMMQWAMESFTNPEIISNTVDIINEYDLLSQSSFNAFTMINYSALRRLGLLPVISKVLHPQSNGNAIQRGNVYTFKNDSFFMSTSQNYHPGTHGDQQAVWQATLSNDLSIFSAHPAVWPDEKGPNGNSPTYWAGEGRLPHSVQNRNINMSLYNIPEKPGLMEKRIIPYTHFWFPELYFDEVILEEKHIFGRLGDVYVGVSTKNPITYIIPEELTKDGTISDPEGRREVIQEGLEAFWITEISTADEEGDFNSFRQRIMENPVSYEKKRLTYASNDHQLELTWQGDFKVDGEIQNLEYNRFDSSYIQAERKAETMEFEFGGEKLFLDFHNRIRESR
ncbi:MULTISPECIES: hypothetical protein [unclassified Oceanispirochaeta]|uniref:hypothetical protein n=1 Tax=unclassified Oceanispirochaeta TaxID=2635722 RepID=UPI000E095B5A|nr:MULTISPECIES: hypothetical protein [unclassified Oceanispirochaeta]MBF9014125.1 hypothetical protein [Oceanispirochaeta sp. M2]NPD70616.1 hypothetical protein [Oceanispirochaeta sp. M1]RDG34381.1 hypothetical protein DV872_00770 [Oceanispirochaeta sp. M1]